MCGIVAIATKYPGDLQSIVETMTNTLIHRGPDDSGFAVLPAEGVALGMRRLSIVDIEGGHQPMWDETSTHGVVFNGEIYNARELRAQLSSLGHTFKTDHSDTEVLVHGYEEWEAEAFARVNGMFAVAIWDRRAKRLLVARDRTGEKPLYIARIPGGFAVASELKALIAHPLLNPDVDFIALEQYFAFDFIPGPRTILRNVEKLPAGYYAIISADTFEARAYWSISFNPRPLTEPAAIAKLDSLMDHSVRSRMVADVPVGLFLSGGLDSTTVGYYMRRYGEDVHSFSIGFEDCRFDESGYAQLAARSLGTKHHLEVFSESRIQDLVPDVAGILDEPMADQSIFPTYLLSRFARGHVKVALGGDGSDELFMGYGTYQALKLAWEMDRIPVGARRAVARIARHLPNRMGRIPLRGKRFVERLGMDPIPRLLSSLGSYRGDSRWILSSSVRACLPASVFDSSRAQLIHGLESTTVANQTIGAYLRGYLQEDILVKVDRASMAVSLEVRAPFLDPTLIDFLGGVSPSLKLRGMTGKYLLRRLMRGRIPDAIIDRRKHGFGVPLNAWLRGSLAPMLRDYLAVNRIENAGFFQPQAIASLIEDHMTGRADRGQELWPVLLFELWRERWLTRAPALSAVPA